MKLSTLVLLLSAALGTTLANAQSPRAGVQAAVGVSGSAASTLKLPETRPGAYLAATRPLLPPPPSGLPELVLPPPLPLGSAVFSDSGAGSNPTPAPKPLTKKSNSKRDKASDTDEGAAREGDAAEEEAPAEVKKKPSNVFLSREVLQKSRDKCQVLLKSADQLKVPAAGGDKTVRLTVMGGRSCVKAISASEDWLSVSALSATDEITVTVQENEESFAREGHLDIANTGSAVHVKIVQEPNLTGFRRIEL